MCLGVRAIPGVRAPGRPGRSAPLGSRPEPAHTRASRAPDPQTKNGDLAPGATHAPLKGPGSLRPPPSTTLVPHFPAPDGPGAQTMLSPPKQRKIIKQGTVNSFPASLASAPAARIPNKLLDSTVCSMSAPGPRASDPPWGEEGEGGAEGAAPGEDCCCSRLSAPAPLPDGPRSGCSGPPPPGPHWLTRWGNRGWEWLKVTKETAGQPVTSPVTVDPGSEGVLAPEEAGAWRSGPADWAERRASRNDRRGPSRPRLSPSALGRDGRAGGNGELLRAPRPVTLPSAQPGILQ